MYNIAWGPRGTGEREENNEALERSRLILITLEPVDFFDFSHKEIADWLRKRQLTFRGLPNFVNLGTRNLGVVIPHTEGPSASRLICYWLIILFTYCPYYIGTYICSTMFVQSTEYVL